ALDEPDPERLARVDARARQDHLERLAATHQPGQALRAAAARDDREIHLGEAELGVLAGDPDVTGERQLEAAAEREATDRSDDRLAAAVHRGAEVDTPARVAEANRHLGRHELADVGTSRERALPSAGDDDHARLQALRELAEAAGQLLAHALVHRVVDVGAVER